jgi:alpha-mannosidase
MRTSVSVTDTKTIVDVMAFLRSLCQVDIQETWQYSSVDGDVSEILTDISTFDRAECNEKGNIAWDKGRRVLWLVQKIVIPAYLHPSYPISGLSLRLALVWWADAASVYVNGKLVAEGDLFDFSPRVLLSDSVKPGDEYIVALRLVSPGHDNGALMRSRLLFDSGDNLDAGFVADQIAVIQQYLESFAPEKLELLTGVVSEVLNHVDAKNIREENKELINHKDTKNTKEENKEVINHRDTEDTEEEEEEEEEEEKFNKSLSTLYSDLLKVPFFKGGWGELKSTIYLLGHAHLDLAWLWQVEETWQAAQNTFESVLKLQADFPDLIFSHSTPALYAWVEEHRPDLFQAIQEKVKAGKWEVVGGFWVEPELNLISGESIVRQLLYGQRYTEAKFGKISPVVWVPDTFGFCWTLPQFMQQAGIEYFVTQKLRWNDTTKFPYGAFWWTSPDGSQIFSYMSALIGEGIDPVKMAAYACEWQIQTGIDDALWLPGVGDHGGGPTRDMLEIAQRWQNSQFFPNLEFITAENYLRHIHKGGNREWGVGSGGGEEKKGKDTEGEKDNQELDAHSIPSTSPTPYSLFPTPLPIWNDELYLEFHRGCYTTHGDQKRLNRKCETLLYEAELFAAWANIACSVNYPSSELETAWKKLLFNQFHDILPGSSITEVYTDALPEWENIKATGNRILQNSLREIANFASRPNPPHSEAIPIFVFNSLNWMRSHVVSINLPDTFPNPCILNSNGEIIPTQKTEPEKLLFLADNIPSVGYRIFWLCPQPRLPKNGHNIAHNKDTTSDLRKQLILSPEKLTLENEFLQVIVDARTGNLTSIFDRINNREILSGAGNQLQAFQDSGQYWDAWNIDPNYTQHPLPEAQLKSIELLEEGEIQTRLRVIRQIGISDFHSDYILEAASPILKIATTVNWQERHVFVKAAFPLNIEADFATYEIPCGAIQRTTKPQTPEEKAKWEGSALRFCDLTEGVGSREWGVGEVKEVGKVGKVGEVSNISPSTSSTPYSLLPTPYGVSILNDCKYGYDATPNQIRLSLLRSPEFPDSEADKGMHEFTYAVYPHAGSWEKAETVRRGYELNTELQVMVDWDANNPQRSVSVNNEVVEDSVSFLNLSDKNLVLMAFKQAEDNPQVWIMRCYECHGETAQMNFQSGLGINLDIPVDLLERSLPTPEFSFGQDTFTIQPWKIHSFKVVG